jgi:hypothetical protein
MTRTPAKPVKLILKDGQDAHGEAADLYFADAASEDLDSEDGDG